MPGSIAGGAFQLQNRKSGALGRWLCQSQWQVVKQDVTNCRGEGLETQSLPVPGSIAGEKESRESGALAELLRRNQWLAELRHMHQSQWYQRAGLKTEVAAQGARSEQATWHSTKLRCSW